VLHQELGKIMKKVIFILGLCAVYSCGAMNQQIQITTVTKADFEANRRARIQQIKNDQKAVKKETEQKILSLSKRPDVFETEQLLLSIEHFKGIALFDPYKEDNQSDDEI
jgi:hypothetical protein